MNLYMKSRNVRAFPVLRDALCLPSGASKNEQGAPHHCPGVVINERGCALCLPRGASKNEQGAPHRRLDVVINEQGFSRVPGRARVKKLVQDYRIRLATWNIGTLTGKTRELVDTMIRRRISIVCLQETKWVGEKAREIEDTGYKLY